MNEKLEKRRKKYKRMVILKTIFIFLFLIVSIILIVKLITKNDTIEAESRDIIGNNEIDIEENKLNSEENITNQSEINSSVEDWNLILVNKDNPIPENYTLETIKIENNYQIDQRIKEATEKMLADARKNGLKPVICSAYRSTKYQTTLFNKKVQEYRKKGFSKEQATELASNWVTIPGTSEHEIGLSLDIIDINYQILDEKQENTAVQKWLMEHCYEYGFILRYPTEKRDITKINYEPWHYRYVGVDDAMIIKEKGFCLEEYIEYLNKNEN